MSKIIQCKFCGCENIRKDGETREKTRYECKDCGKHFTIGDGREKINMQTKLLISLLYSTKSMRIIDIANYLGVSRPTVYNCITDVLGRFDEPVSSLYSRKAHTNELEGTIRSIDKKHSTSNNQDNYSNEWTVFDLSQASKIKGILLLKKIPKIKKVATR